MRYQSTHDICRCRWKSNKITPKHFIAERNNIYAKSASFSRQQWRRIDDKNKQRKRIEKKNTKNIFFSSCWRCTFNKVCRKFYSTTALLQPSSMFSLLMQLLLSYRFPKNIDFILSSVILVTHFVERITRIWLKNITKSDAQPTVQCELNAQ